MSFCHSPEETDPWLGQQEKTHSRYPHRITLTPFLKLGIWIKLFSILPERDIAKQKEFPSKHLMGGMYKCLLVKLSQPWGGEANKLYVDTGWGKNKIKKKVRFQADCIFLSYLISVGGKE